MGLWIDLRQRLLLNLQSRISKGREDSIFEVLAGRFNLNDLPLEIREVRSSCIDENAVNIAKTNDK